ncbi:MAG: sigma-54 dependent transcriptional regulator [Gammaproteobacteria bacterium]|nr:sigma-54 dependent transcriptional regulator [Gammaproteobacteria bacterium]
MNRILILDDEEVIRTALRHLLERAGYRVAEAADAAAAEALQPDSFDLILADLRLPGAPGTTIIPLAGGVPVVIMTSYASVRSAVESMKQGAVDYIAKPFDHDELLLLVERAIQQNRLWRQNAALKMDLQREYPIQDMIGECEAMRDVRGQIARVAPTDMTVLILGESGTGKELVARALHEQSRRRDSPIVAVNCASIPEGLIESELFGHEKGAFTGAVKKYEGLVRSADSGTLFLDEIGELPAGVQARLLRVLENNEIRPVGSTKSRSVNIRLVAATHRNLDEMVEQGEFREDLYYRLKVMEILLPPLRERQEDILNLANYLLDKTVKSLSHHALHFTPEALNAIRGYRWQGNVRELQNAVERAVILADGNEISVQHLGLTPAAADSTDQSSNTAYDLSLDEYFRRCVLTNQASCTETDLARLLGISRKALWERRQRMNLPRD